MNEKNVLPPFFCLLYIPSLIGGFLSIDKSFRMAIVQSSWVDKSSELIPCTMVGILERETSMLVVDMDETWDEVLEGSPACWTVIFLLFCNPSSLLFFRSSLLVSSLFRLDSSAVMIFFISLLCFMLCVVLAPNIFDYLTQKLINYIRKITEISKARKTELQVVKNMKKEKKLYYKGRLTDWMKWMDGCCEIMLCKEAMRQKVLWMTVWKFDSVGKKKREIKRRERFSKL